VFDSVMSGFPAVISSGQMLSEFGCFPSLQGVDKPRRYRRMKAMRPAMSMGPDNVSCCGVESGTWLDEEVILSFP